MYDTTNLGDRRQKEGGVDMQISKKQKPAVCLCVDMEASIERLYIYDMDIHDTYIHTYIPIYIYTHRASAW